MQDLYPEVVSFTGTKENKMKVKNIVNVIVSLLVVVGLLASAAPAFAAGVGPDDSHHGEVKGTISAVDAAAGTLTITPRTGSPLALTIGATTQIKRVGKMATAAALKVGDLAQVKYDTTTKLASKIDARLNIASLKGTISAVDATAGTLTVKKLVGGAEVSLSIDSGTAIRRNGKLATSADLRVADMVEVKYNPVTHLAYRIQAKLFLVNLNGVISALDSSARTMTVKGMTGTETMLTVDPSAFIKRLGKTATLAELKVGDKVEIKYNPITKIAYRIEAKLNLVSTYGAISAVDAAAGTISVLNPITNVSLALAVDPAAVITRMGKIVTLAELQVGERVEVKYNPLTLVAYKIEVKLASFKGAVTAIDATARTMTVKNALSGVQVSVTVDPAAVITNHSAPYTLAQIMVGNLVEVKYNGATLVAYRIEVK
jgi:hypothetical protein